MLREIIKPTEKQLKIEIPQEYINKEVEVLVLPLFEMEKPIETENQGFDEDLMKLFKNAPNIKIDPTVDIDDLMNEVNDVVL